MGGVEKTDPDVVYVATTSRNFVKNIVTNPELTIKGRRGIQRIKEVDSLDVGLENSQLMENKKHGNRLVTDILKYKRIMQIKDPKETK